MFRAYACNFNARHAYVLVHGWKGESMFTIPNSMSVIVAYLFNMSSWVVGNPVELIRVFDGIRIAYTFPNKWGVSIICHSGSYGGPDGLWEVGVTYDGELNYDNPITGYDAVIGYRSADDVLEILREIQTLSEGPECG